MESEIQQFHRVKKYLQGLGYPPDSIFYEYQTEDKKRHDLAVKVNDKVLVVVEVKGKNILNLDNLKEIGYNPIARKLQKEAQESGAKFYIISTGGDHIWLQTGEGGRPELADEKPFKSFDLDILSETRYTKDLLHNVVELLRNSPISDDNLLDVSLIFYIKLTKEIVDRHFSIKNNLSALLEPISVIKNGSEINDAYKTLERVLSSLTNLEFKKHIIAVLEFIDECFKYKRQEWYVPRWLGDLMLNTVGFRQKDHIIDIFAKNGVLTSAAYLNDVPYVTSFISNRKDYYWIKIYQLLLEGKEVEIKFSSDYDKLTLLKSNLYDGAILAPPFNQRFNNLNYGVLGDRGSNDSTSIFLEAAINTVKHGGKIIAIVPDSFLTSSNYKPSRKYLLEEGCIESIISLPLETFKPLRVKTSIITFIKGEEARDVFFASIEEVPKGSPFQVQDSNILQNVNKKLSSFKKNGIVDFSKNGFAVKNLDVENFQISKYWFELNHGNSQNLQHGFLSVPLKELLLKVIKGDSLVEDKESGEIPFINPASIRSMRLLKSELSFTSKSKIPKRANRVEVDDVVINTIGNYRGSAALVTTEFNGLFFNRHVIAVRPNRNLIIQEYLVIALNSRFVKEQFYDSSTGAVIPAINLKSLENIYIPVLNLDEQEKIVAEYYNIVNELSYINEKAHGLEASLNEKLNHFGREEGRI